MACLRCAPFFDPTPRTRIRAELEGVFHILEERQDKLDSATMGWYGQAQCLACGQRARFHYESGFTETGSLTALT